MTRGTRPGQLLPRGDKRRDQIITFIRLYRRRFGYSPTVREIAHGIGGASTGNVYWHLNILEGQGRITVRHGMGRTILLGENET
jgi:SOS-response transcriptional repressor LexA